MASKETSREAGAAGRDREARSESQDSAKAEPQGTGDRPDAAAAPAEQPDWSHGLRQLYDSVVEEDLPDSFRALLDRLDEADPDEPTDGSQPDPPAHTPTKGDGA